MQDASSVKHSSSRQTRVNSHGEYKGFGVLPGLVLISLAVVHVERHMAIVLL